MGRIYLDHSATTPLDKDVFSAMRPYFCDKFGNASSLHSYGQEAAYGVEKARLNMAECLNCEPKEIIFTSGATEANNLAINGLVRGLRKIDPRQKIHIITTKIEHDSVLEVMKNLEAEGVDITYLSVDKNGVIRMEELKKSIRDDTRLVSVMYVNSEVGSLQPVKKIGRLISDLNEERYWKWNNADKKARGDRPQPIYFHTDAVQAFNYFSCDTKSLKVDMLSLSAHKMYGPKGVGALFVKEGTPIKQLVFGGRHERGLRSGTLNVPAIVGFGKAMMSAEKNRQKNNKNISALRDRLIAIVIKKVPAVILNTDVKNSSPSHANFSFPGAEGESILISLDLAGIAVSTGSACASGSLEPSHVLSAMGIKPEICHSSVRFTVGKNNTKEEIDRVIKILPKIIARIRKIAPNLS